MFESFNFKEIGKNIWAGWPFAVIVVGVALVFAILSADTLLKMSIIVMWTSMSIAFIALTWLIGSIIREERTKKKKKESL